MIRKYQNRTLQTNPRHRDEEPQKLFCSHGSFITYAMYDITETLSNQIYTLHV